MPRTFSRGQKFTAQTLFQLFDGYLPPREADEFAREARVRFCPEEPLEEFDFTDLIDLLRRALQRLRLVLRLEPDPVFVAFPDEPDRMGSVKILTELAVSDISAVVNKMEGIGRV